MSAVAGFLLQPWLLSQPWAWLREELERLLDFCNAYREHLVKTLEAMKRVHASPVPARSADSANDAAFRRIEAVEQVMLSVLPTAWLVFSSPLNGPVHRFRRFMPNSTAFCQHVLSMNR